MTVCLSEMLEAREARFRRQTALLKLGMPLVSFSMNLAGPEKRSALSDFAFRQGLAQLQAQCGPAQGSSVLWQKTGAEALLAYPIPAQRLKAICMALEEAQPVGRLFDLDVLEVSGQKCSRSQPRACLVCGGPAALCARSRAHGLASVQAATQALLEQFAIQTLAQWAVDSLLEEVALTPKPGLVDRNNSGAHRDMDEAMFRSSALALRAYFGQAVQLGLSSSTCMGPLQQAGLQAEMTMLQVTGGVNTHKGAIYSFGLLLAALGSRLARGGDVFQTAAVLAKAGIPAQGTHGAAVQHQYGAGGARQQAEQGFPAARDGQKALERLGPYGALLTLMASLEDTNLLHRGGPDGLCLVQTAAAEILNQPSSQWPSRLAELDRQLIARNLSPGGSADLLALSFFLNKTKEIWGE